MPTILCLDSGDRIRETGGNWDRFALENGGPVSGTDQLEGRPINEFISGDPSRTWVNALLSFVRLTRRSIHQAYRADSPLTRRLFTLEIQPEQRSGIRMIHHPEWEEKRLIPCSFVSGSFPASTIRRCSWCLKIEYQSLWMEADELPDAVELCNPLPVYYVVCYHCQRKMDQLLRNHHLLHFGPSRGRHNHEPA